MTRIKLDLRATGTGNVELNGVDVSTAVAGVTVNANVGDMTSVLIRLPAVAVTMDGEARVKLAPQVRELLLAAGWTPPAPPRTDDLGTPLHAEDVDGSPIPRRKLIGPAHAHLDAPCTDACWETVE